MKRALLIVACLVVTGSAGAATYTGNRLSELCVSDKSFVLGYVVGMADKAGDDIGIASARLAGDLRLATLLYEIENYCIPKEATLGQAVDVFCKFLRDNPGERHLPASVLAAKSFSKVWPCKR